MAKVGRTPFKITEDIIKKVEALAAQGLTIDQISIVLGCNSSTLYNKKRQLRELNDAIKRGREKGIAKVTNALFNKAVAGDNIAMIFFLKNRDRENWKDKIDNTHSGPNGGPIETITKIERVIVDKEAPEQKV